MACCTEVVIKLTDEQREQIRKITGKLVSSVVKIELEDVREAGSTEAGVGPFLPGVQSAATRT